MLLFFSLTPFLYQITYPLTYLTTFHFLTFIFTFALSIGSCNEHINMPLFLNLREKKSSFDLNFHSSPYTNSLFLYFTLPLHFSKLCVIIFYSFFHSYLSQTHFTQIFTLLQNCSHQIPMSIMMLNPTTSWIYCFFSVSSFGPSYSL